MTSKTDPSVRQFLETYDIRDFGDIPDDVRCTICGRVMIDACYGPCSCRYCVSCIEFVIGSTEQKKCPGNKRICGEFEMSSACIKPDESINHKIATLEIRCPKEGCHFMDYVRSMTAHLITCSYVTDRCPFHNIGCGLEGLTQTEVTEHVNTNNVRHSVLMIQCMENVKNQMQAISDGMESLKAVIAEKIGQLEDRVTSIERMVLENKDNVDRMVNDVRMWHGEATNGTEPLSRSILQSQGSNQMDSSQNRTQMNDDIVIVKENRHVKGSFFGFFKPRFYSHNKIFCDEFTWRVDDLTQMRDDRLHVESSTFYSSDGSYAFRLIIYPHGVNNDSQHSVFVGFALMVGDMDYLVDWPCRRRLQINVLRKNSRDSFKTAEYHYDTTPDECKCGYDRPSWNCRIWLGQAKFVSWTDLIRDKTVYDDDGITLLCCIRPP